MKMTLGVATKCWENWMDCVFSWNHCATQKRKMYVVSNQTILSAYEYILRHTNSDIIAYLHDDLMIYEPGWDTRVMLQFQDPKVGMVGFGGALGHGVPHLYTAPYYLPNLARQHFMSNMRSAETHGARFNGQCDVAVLDGFSLIVRRSILEKAGGWDQRATYFMYAEWLSCEVRRQGYRIRLVGIDCEHLGGKSSTAGLTDNYEEAHRYFYEKNKDVMPYAVTG